MKRVLLLISIIISVVSLAQQKKVALIIGNDKYDGHFSTLHTPLNDAEGMANVLYKLGFDTIVGKNVSRGEMSTYLRKFKKQANGAEMVLFYFSGHAGTAKEQYYLAPSGRFESQATLTADCYPFSNLVSEVREIAPIKLIIIDACRNSIDDNKGHIYNFSPEKITNNPRMKGTIYWFATGVNKVAKTGEGKYSLFTASLLSHIGDFDNLESIGRKISDEVTRANSEQIPNYSDKEEIAHKIYLNPLKLDIHSLILEGIDYYSFSTTPSNAIISVDGKTYNSGEKIPLTIGKSYDINISAEGYAKYNEKITATRYKNDYDITLDELAETKLNINSNVNGATVYFDGQRVGVAPVYNIHTYAGPHDIRLEKKGYYNYSAWPILKGGSQTHEAEMIKQRPWFTSWDDDEMGVFSYHYCPNYPIGLSLMYRPEGTRFSFGGMMGLSFGLFRGWGDKTTVTTTQSSSTSITVIDENGNSVVQNLKTTMDGKDDASSDFLDPYNEAKHYNAYFMFLANGGYNICNGIMLEAGIGAAYHQDLYYMEKTYAIKKTSITDSKTGEEKELSREYIQQDNSDWYRRNTKWSPAIRLGTRFFIPLNSYYDCCLSLGAGYTYLTNNTSYSSWDVNIGITF